MKIPVYNNSADVTAESAARALEPRDHSGERRHG